MTNTFSIQVIVMTTRTMERSRTKCGQYWPELEGKCILQAETMRYLQTDYNQGTSLQCGVFSVTTENIENYEDFVVTDLKLTHSGMGEER